MAKKALLVLDMLKDFMDEKGTLYCGKEAVKIVPFIKQKIKEFREKDFPVLFIMDSHAKDDPEFKLFPKHCVTGSEGAKLTDDLKPEKGDILIPKTTYDAMHNSNLDVSLKERGIKETYLTGVCTSICVMETADSLTKKDYKVFIYKDGVADFDKDAHKFALKRMKTIYGVEII